MNPTIGAMFLIKVLAGGEPMIVAEPRGFFADYEKCMADAVVRNGPTWDDMREQFHNDGRLIIQQEWQCVAIYDFEQELIIQALRDNGVLPIE